MRLVGREDGIMAEKGKGQGKNRIMDKESRNDKEID